MDETALWMLGIGSFGVVFYLLAIYFQNSSGLNDRSDDSDID